MRVSRWFVMSVAIWLSASAGAAPESGQPGHYLFAWSGAVGDGGEDFIAVVDADPHSAHYGELITSVASGIVTQQFITPSTGCLTAPSCLPTITCPVIRSSSI